MAVDFDTTGITRPEFPANLDCCVVAFQPSMGDPAFVGITAMKGDFVDWDATFTRDQAEAMVEALQQAIRRLWGE